MTRLTARFNITSTQEAYLNTRMQQVSRSFALVVPWLEAPLNHYMATAYLLCRVVDNIEDCSQPAAWKRQRFAEAVQLLDQPRLAVDVLTNWQQDRWPGLTAEERQLMGLDGQSLWQIYAGIPEASRFVIHRWIWEMVKGMSQLDMPEKAPHFVDRRGIRVLVQEVDYDQYCYIVAGTVGYMSTELVIQHYNLPGKVAQRLLADCEACGRSLQKTNIVKDFAEDLNRGVSYLPDQWLQEVGFAPLSLQGAPPAWSRKVLDNVLSELADATNYVLALPYKAAGYRMASLMSLLPAYQTVLLAARQQAILFTREHHVKISRQSMAQCIWDARNMVSNNQMVWQYSQQIQQAINATFDIPAKKAPVASDCVAL